MLPLVVISGFLGSGKTTAINRLLANPAGRKLAVIVNDIGEINIDDELIEHSSDSKIALTNGCICCSLKSDLFDAVVTLARENSVIDAIVIEASGIAHPASLVAWLKLLESSGVTHTDTVVYLVDGQNFDALDFDQGETMLDHAAACDLLVINKCDVAASEVLACLNQQLDIVATDTRRIEVEFGDIPAALLFSPSIARRSIVSEIEPGDAGHHGYREQTLIRDTPVERSRFDALISDISSYAWRAKGFVCFSENPGQVYLFNLVGQRASLQACDHRCSGMRLVIIGRSAVMPETIKY
ncbi:MAG: G3E family GTPase [Planctomycetota bacterium]|jgi:G3E family GTPase